MIDLEKLDYSGLTTEVKPSDNIFIELGNNEELGSGLDI